jgi:hypothetical protein
MSQLACASSDAQDRFGELRPVRPEPCAVAVEDDPLATEFDTGAARADSLSLDPLREQGALSDEADDGCVHGIDLSTQHRDDVEVGVEVGIDHGAHSGPSGLRAGHPGLAHEKRPEARGPGRRMCCGQPATTGTEPRYP